MAYDVVFDNGGGITLMAEGYTHYYNDPTQAAEDVKVLMETNSTDGWEGDEPESRIQYDYEAERNGGLTWRSHNDIEELVKGTGPIDQYKLSGHAEREFAVALTGRPLMEE